MARKRRGGNRNKRSAPKRSSPPRRKVQRQIRKASSDGRVTRKEVKKIQRVAKRNNVNNSTKIVKRIVSQQNSNGKNVKIGGNAAKSLKIRKKVLNKVNAGLKK